LGGGSSNAATTLIALNHLWGLHLSTAKLQEIGAQLGADVQVFVAGRTACAEGIGDKLTPIELTQSFYLIIAPDCRVSTVEIFSHRQLTRNTSPIKMAAFFDGDSRNDCQQLVRQIYPEVDKALNLLAQFGEARLTGTGACVFTRFDNEETAKSAQGQLPSSCESYIARGINQSSHLDAQEH